MTKKRFYTAVQSAIDKATEAITKFEEDYRKMKTALDEASTRYPRGIDVLTEPFQTLLKEIGTIAYDLNRRAESVASAKSELGTWTTRLNKMKAGK